MVQEQANMLVIDIDEEMTRLSVAPGNATSFSKEFHPGYALVTKEICYQLKVGYKVAEELRDKHGIAHPSVAGDEKSIEYLSVDGITKRYVSNKVLSKVIQGVLRTMFTQSKKEFHESGVYFKQDEILQLEGKWIKLPGVDIVANEVFGIKVELA